MVAAAAGHKPIVEKLIANGADVCARNDKNLTAIDYANQKEFNGWDDIVQILIEEAKGLDIKGVDFKDEDVSAACTNIEELDIRG